MPPISVSNLHIINLLRSGESPNLDATVNSLRFPAGVNAISIAFMSYRTHQPPKSKTLEKTGALW